MANDWKKRAERRCARAAEQVFRTREPMSSGLVAESELTVARNFSTFSGAKDRVQEQLGMTGKGVGTESEGLEIQVLEANTGLRWGIGHGEEEEEEEEHMVFS